MFIYRPFPIAIFLFMFLAAGCSSTTLTGSWNNPEYSGQVNKVYIIGIAKDGTTRRIFEDELRNQLQSHGVTGVASYHDLPLSEETDKAEIEKRVKADGADSVFITRTVGKRTEQVVNPGRISSYDNSPYSRRGGYRPDPYYRNYGSYYSRSREIVYEPATVDNFEVVTLEANLYNAANGELIWSAQLETFVESGIQKLITDFVAEVVKDLKGRGLI